MQQFRFDESACGLMEHDWLYTFGIYSLLDIWVSLTRTEKRSRQQTFKIRDSVDIHPCLNFRAVCGPAEVELRWIEIPQSCFVGVPLYKPTYVPSTSNNCVCTIGQLFIVADLLSVYGFKFKSYKFCEIAMRLSNYVNPGRITVFRTTVWALQPQHTLLFPKTAPTDNSRHLVMSPGQMRTQVVWK